MRGILYTGYDAPYAELAAITVPRMAEWAKRRDMDFVFWEDTPPVGLNIYWTGVAQGLGLLRENYDFVMYLDADQLITNYDVEFKDDLTRGFHASKDWGEDTIEPWQFSACGFIAGHSCIPLFERVLELEPEFRDKPFQEQAPLQAVVKAMLEGVPLVEKRPGDPQRGFINIHPRRVFNAVPDTVCPGKVPEPWNISCFSAHLTMAPMERRIEIAKEILGKL